MFCSKRYKKYLLIARQQLRAIISSLNTTCTPLFVARFRTRKGWLRRVLISVVAADCLLDGEDLFVVGGSQSVWRGPTISYGQWTGDRGPVVEGRLGPVFLS